MKNILLILLSFSLSFSYAQVQIGGDIDGEAGDNFGRSVSLSSDGNRMAVGASKDGSSTSSGYVRVYELIGSDWQQIGNDIYGDAGGDQFGWSISLSSNGSRLAIGATGGDGNGINSGLVRIYDLIGSDWQQIGGDIIGESAGDWSGQSVSLSQNGNIVAIGAIFNDGNGSGAGHVRVFELNGGVWQQLGADLDGASAGDKFGTSVSLSSNGNILAIGAIGGVNIIGNNNQEGYVRVYELNGGVWQQLGGDLVGTSIGDQFGRPVSLSSNGKILAIGAQGNGEGEIAGGQVKIFKLTGGIWQQLGNDINGEAVYAAFGWAVSLSSDGSIVAIGAPSSVLASSDNDGKVRIYELSAGTWNLLGFIIDGEAEFDRSGYAVSLSSDGNKVAIGAIENDGNGEFAGHVRVYDLSEVISEPCFTANIICPDDIVMPLNDSGFCDSIFVNVPLPIAIIDPDCVGGVPQIINLSSGQVPLNISPQTGLSSLGVTNFTINGAPTTTIADVIITGIWNSDNGSSSERPTFTLEGNSLGLLPSGGGDCSENAFTFIIPIAVYNMVAADGLLDFTIGANNAVNDFCTIDYIDINLAVQTSNELLPYVNDFNGEADASGIYPIGVTTVTYCTFDALGEETCCSFTVTILDPVAPIINCPPDITEDCGTDCPPLTPPFSLVETPFTETEFMALGGTITENCSIASLTYIDTEAGVCPVVVTRTFTATDTGGNSSTCEQTINVFDNTPPQLVCPPTINENIDISNQPPYPSLVAFLAAGGIATDAVSFSLDSEVTDGATCPETITRVYAVSDECGNVSTCEQLLVFIEPTPLVITCPDDILTSNVLGACDGGFINIPLPTLNDACVSGIPEIINLSSGQIPLNIAPQTDLSTLGVTTFTIGNAPITTISDVIITGVWNSDNGASSERPTFALEGTSIGLLPSGGGDCNENTFTLTIPAAVYNVAANDGALDFTVGADFSVDDFCSMDYIDINIAVSTGNQLLLYTNDFNGSEDASGVYPVGVTTVTYCTFDGLGNEVCCSFTVTVLDTEAPLISCPFDILENCGTDCPPLVPPLSLVDAPFTETEFLALGGTITENCPIGSLTYIDAEAGSCPIVVTRIFTVTDTGGNSSTCEQTFNVFDNTPPEIICPPTINENLAIANQPPYPNFAAFLAAGGMASDTIDFSLDSEITDGATCPETITRVYSVSDECGNVSTCQQQLILTDPTPPVITCPNDIVMPAVPGTCDGGFINIPLPTVDNVCVSGARDTVNLSSGQIPLNIAPQTGLPTLGETYFSIGSAPTSTIADVTITGVWNSDNNLTSERPTFTLEGNSIGFLPSGGADCSENAFSFTIPIGVYNVVAADGVLDFTVGADISIGDFCAIDYIDINLEVVIVSQLVPYVNDFNGEADASDVYPIGVTTVNYCTLDAFGNEICCSFTVTILDPDPLILSCPNDVIMTIDPGVCDSVFVNIPLPTFNSTCIREIPPIVNLTSGQVPLNIAPQTNLSSLGVTNFSIGGAPTNTIEEVVITGVWNSDNGSTSERPTFTLEGNSLGLLPSGGGDCSENAFSFTIPIAVYNLVAADGILDFTVGADGDVDSFCSTDYIDIILEVVTGSVPLLYINDFNDKENASGVYPIGVTTVTYCALDAFENEVCCSFTVTILDPIAPLITCPMDQVENCGAGCPSLTPPLSLIDTIITEAEFFALGGTITEDCNIASVSYIDSEAGICPTVVTRTFTATDESGNASTCAQTITVFDNTPPELSCPPTINENFAIANQPAYPNLAAFLAAGGTASDTIAFSLVSEVSDGARCPESITRVYAVSDECGNVSTCEQLLTFYEPAPLVITCPIDIVTPIAPGACDGGFINIPLPTLNDACLSGIPQVINLSSGQVPLNIAPQTGLSSLGVTNFMIGNAATTTIADVIITGVWNSDNGSSSERPTFMLEGTLLGNLPSGGGDCNENAFTFTIPISVYNVVAADGVLDFTVGANGNVDSFCAMDYIDINLAVQTDNELLPYINDFNGQADASGIYPIGVTTVNYCTLDGLGDEVCCSFTVTVLDAVAPLISCPADQLEDCGTDCPPLVPPLSLVDVPLTVDEFLAFGGTISENCSAASLTYSDTKAGLCPVVVTRIFTVTDTGGNTNTCKQTINIFDNTPPEIVCPPTINENFSIANHPPYPDLSAFLSAGGVATDAVSFSLDSEVTDGASCPETITRVYSVSDECGNVSTCEQLLVLVHPTPLVITCPNDIVMPTPPGACDGGFINIPLPTLNDACVREVPQIINLSSGQVPLNISPQTGLSTLGVTSFSISSAPTTTIDDVIITGVWNSDNGASVESPTFTLEGNLLGNLPSGGGDCNENIFTFTIPIAVYNEVAADGALDFTVGADTAVDSFCDVDYIDVKLAVQTGTGLLPYINDFNGQADASGIYPIGVTTVTYCALDGLGNEVCCSFTVTVLDPEPLALTCPNDIVMALAPGACDGGFINIPLPTINNTCVIDIPAFLNISSGQVPLNIAPQTGLPTLGETNFSIDNAPTATFADVQLTGIWNSDNDLSNERPTLILEGNIIGLLPSGGLECVENAFTFTIPTAVYNEVAADGKLDFIVGADFSVGSNCSIDYIDINLEVLTGPELLPFVNDYNGREDASGVYPIGATTVTYCALDVFENETCCSFNVTVLDTEAPLISCPTDQLEDCGTNCPPIEPPLSLVDVPLTEAEFTAFGGTITETCEIVSLTYLDTESGICPIVITRTFTATDDSGNTSTCEQTINIFDNTPPEIVCPATIVGTFAIADQPPYPNYSAFQAAGGIATDTIAFSMVSEDTDGGTCPEIITRVYSVSDECGNASTCKQFLILNNPTPPEISCPPNIMVECGTPTDPMSTGMATANTNCGGIMITSIDNFIINCGITGIIERTWTARDSIGNTSSCTQTITIIDTTPPVFDLCPTDVTINCDQPIDTMTLGNAKATDTCPAMMMGMLPSAFDSDNGFAGNMFDLKNVTTLPVLISGFDGNVEGSAGQSATFEIYYRVGTYIGFENNQAGWISMGTATTVTAGGDMPTPVPIGGLTLLPGQTYGIYFVLSSFQNVPALRYTNGNNTFNDGVLELTAGIGKGNPDFLGSTFPLRTWNGNIHYNIEAPVFSSQTFEETSTQAMGCSEFNYSVNRTWTTIDNCGNSATCAQEITVKDNNFPTINCPIDITIECDQAIDPAVTGNATASGDDCSVNNDITITFSDLSTQVPTDCGNDRYIITRTWTASFSCGNASTCIQTITVEDTTPPTITCPSDLTIECTEDTSPETTGMATAIDGCSAAGEIVITFADISTQGTVDCSQFMYTITRTWTATDACGNTTTCIQIINVNDTTPPAITCPGDLTIECTEDTSPGTTGMATGIDDCSNEGEVVITFVDASTQKPTGCIQFMYTITRTWTATDACGRTATCIQTINVEDTTAPVMTCPADISVACTDSTLPIDTGIATAADNCSSENEIKITSSDVSTQAEEGCGQFTFDITRTWTATDICGNTATCVQSITLADTEGPDISCPPNETLSCNTIPPAGARLASEFTESGGAILDNCTSSLSDFSVDYIDFPSNPETLNTCPGSAEEDRTITRTYLITDLCGNTSTCEQLFIYLESMEAPTVTSFPSDQTVDCAVNVFPQLPQFSATGDCSNITYSVSEPVVNGPEGCSGTRIEYTYTATDDCGRFATHVQRYTLSNEGPEFICPIGICVIECPADFDVMQTQFDDYSSLATVTSSCLETSISIENDFDPDEFIPQDCSNPIVAVNGAIAYQIVTFTATDACGWSVTCTALVVVTDTEGPVVDGDVSFGLANCTDTGLEAEYTNWATSQLSNLSATDECFDEAVNFTYEPLSPNIDCSSGLASTEVSFIGMDGCGNTTTLTAFYRIINTEMSTLRSTTSKTTEFSLLQNKPNPFANETMIEFHLPEMTDASLTIFDIAGRVVWTQTKSYKSGVHQVIIDKASLGATGIFYYQLSTSKYSATRKMIVLQ